MKEISNNNQEQRNGKVWLLGAGPGDIGLLTCKAKEVLSRAEVVIYDALISTEILAIIPNQTEKINAGKRAGAHTMPQEEINYLLLQRALEGKQVVRLKGGDPFVFGRGGEELELLAKQNIPFEIIPGVTSAIAVPAYAGIPVTHRDMASSFHIITGHTKQEEIEAIDYSALVKMKATLIFLMGVSSLPILCKHLLEAGMSPYMPAAIISKGTTARQKKVLATLGTLEEKTKQEKIEAPAVILFGEVCKLTKDYDWTKNRPLNEKSIIVTRPVNRSSSIVEKLRFLGAQVIEMPSIQTKSLKNNQRLKEKIEEICQSNEEEWLVFTSPSGVKLFFEQLIEWRIDLRELFCHKIKIAVIGSGTKKELESHGIFADIMPKEYSAKALGNLLVEIFQDSKYLGKQPKKIDIIRAKEGSKDLIVPLDKAGIEYEDISFYETVFVQNETLAERVKEMLFHDEIDFIIFTSASTVKGFLKATGLTKEHLMSLKNFYAICIGEKTKKEAEKYGMQVRVSKEATIDSMIELISSLS